MNFEGPGKLTKRTKTFAPFANPAIVDAFMNWNGNIYPLGQNTLIVEADGDHYEVWHSFYYFDLSGAIAHGSYYNFQSSKDDLILDARGCLILKMEYYETEEGEGGPAEFHIFLEPNVKFEFAGT